MKRITITVRDDVAARIEREAQSRGVTLPKAVSEIVTEALHMRRRKEELDENGRRIIPWLGMASVGGWPGGADVDEYLAKHWAADISDGWSEPGDDRPFDREAAQNYQDEMDGVIGEHWNARDAARHQRG